MKIWATVSARHSRLWTPVLAILCLAILCTTVCLDWLRDAFKQWLLEFRARLALWRWLIERALAKLVYPLSAQVHILILLSRLRSQPSHRRALLASLQYHGRRSEDCGQAFLHERHHPTFQGVACAVI